MKPIVRIQYVNFYPGFDDQACRTQVLMELCDDFTFVFDDAPDILLVGCYGQRAIPECRALKVGYYTENLPPDLDNFDYFFGCEYSDVIQHSRYCKRVFGSFGRNLVEECADPGEALRSKDRFCSFVYSARVPYRERFFSALSRYKAVSAPGRSMNNCSDLMARDSPDWHQAKREYLRSFKFTIAFENSRRIGYATEKLYDALNADTVPIYWGDPQVERVINTDAIIVVDGDWERDVLPWLQLPERRMPFRPYHRDPTLSNKIFGRANDLFRWIRARVPYHAGFRSAIEQVVELDNDANAYFRKLSASRTNPQVHAIRRDYFEFWRAIISTARGVRAAS